METLPTLHDFVLNLLCDPAARSTFELDPEGALQDAGLGDITAADVQEVIPLVLDYAPVAANIVPAGVDDLVPGVPELDIAGAVAQLQAITSQVTMGAWQASADVNIAVASAVTLNSASLLSQPLTLVDGVGLGLTSVVSADVDTLVGGGLSIDHDPAANLDVDIDVVAPVTGTVTGLVPGADQFATDTVSQSLDVAVNAATGVTSTVGLLHPLDLDDAAVVPATSSVGGSMVRPDTAVGGVLDGDHTAHNLVSDAPHVGGVLSGATDSLAAVTGHDSTDGIDHLLF
jgi:hypothetical protein